ncbi:DUF1045 domain-containing protein [Pelagibius litoralis]|uniref:DUF1045 domain-containing protein n=1 Tax=Pelagibius litoralis TaxID=374515 RepID=A0A967C6H7_9PROT|nr:DUF1045 domain-containing protein [Pelagibius litoralis]NIA67467.1 DUF1045 domain-containing protein [Pelagibius litoralis]
MTTNHQPRYAVYYALPRESALWSMAQTWLGRDCENGARLPQPALEGWTQAEIAEVTESPRRYGFHATLKAPFPLAPGISRGELRDAVAAFAAAQQPFQAAPLTVSAIGPFLALTLSEPTPAMAALATAAVTDLDPLRAPLAEADIQRRLGNGLSSRQEELLRAWGYPYVLEEFRFHMTLTGPLAQPEKRARLQSALAAHFKAALEQPVPVQEVCLYSQDNREAPFFLAERFRFAAAATTEQGQAKS